MSAVRTGWIGAAEAARLLGVSRATLYAYVSRGYLRSQPSAGATRERAYARDDVERLRRRSEERRSPDKAAARVLQWGMPILESSIALIDGRGLYYRGLDAAQLARTRSFDEVMALIWAGRLDAPIAPAGAARAAGARPGDPFIARAQAALAAEATRDRLASDLRAEAVAATGARIVRLLAATAAGAVAGGETVDGALARAWKAGPQGAAVIRAALILCADHELNVSSFTARCVASAGSHPYAVVIAGLAALEGPRHGGASARVEAMLATLRRARSLPDALDARRRRGEPIDGFGHPLYRDGDPRAMLLLELLGAYRGPAAARSFVVRAAAAGRRITGEPPNLDFALAAAARVLGLPAGAPLTLFAIGRSVGWIGHAIEQYATGQLIRPRARYVGVPIEDVR